MVPQKQKAIIKDLSSCIESLVTFSLEYAMNVDKKDSHIPSEDIEFPIINLLKFVVRSHKHDHKNLFELYNSGRLWKEAIREAFCMDDKEEKGYWFYHIYGIEPNILFKIYMEEHLPIALEKVLEMFERDYGEEGYRKAFLGLAIKPEDIRRMNLFDHGVDEILNIIQERYIGSRLGDTKKVGKFFAWLYTLDKKKIEKVLQEYESVADDALNEIADSCRYTLEHEAPEQLPLLRIA